MHAYAVVKPEAEPEPEATFRIREAEAKYEAIIAWILPARALARRACPGLGLRRLWDLGRWKVCLGKRDGVGRLCVCGGLAGVCVEVTRLGREVGFLALRWFAFAV